MKLYYGCGTLALLRQKQRTVLCICTGQGRKKLQQKEWQFVLPLLYKHNSLIRDYLPIEPAPHATAAPTLTRSTR